MTTIKNFAPGQIDYIVGDRFTQRRRFDAQAAENVGADGGRLGENRPLHLRPTSGGQKDFGGYR